MKTKSLIFIFACVLLFDLPISSDAESTNPLKPGMTNTVTLADGSVVYDLNGEWDAVIDNGRFGVSEDIIKITQEGNKFVGIKLIGNQWVGKGEETIKGELDGDGFKSFEGYTRKFGWLPCSAKVLDGGNKIVEELEIESANLTTSMTLTRK